MPHRVVEYRGLLISPGDVEVEREALSDLVAHWNASVGSAVGCRIALVRWETHAVPDAATEPQKAINRQLVDDCDFGLAVFWSRIGSPTSSHASGSLEEIERLLQRGARVLIYFSTAAIPQAALHDEQFAKLQRFKAEMQPRGLVGSYTDVPNLREQVQLHLTSVISGMLERDREQPAPAESTATRLTAPTPDLRIRVRAVVVLPSSGVEAYVQVTAQNHSPVPVFIAGIMISLTERRGLFPPRDAFTQEHQGRRRLEPGQSYEYLLNAQELLKMTAVEDLDAVVVSDEVGREYRSTTEELRKAVQEAAKHTG